MTEAAARPEDPVTVDGPTPDVVADARDAFLKRTEDAITAFAEAIDDVADAVRREALTALEAHGQLPPAEERAGPPLAPPDQGYASACADRVLAPLANELSRLELGEALRKQWEALEKRLEEAVAAVPEKIVRAELRELYAASPEDGLGTRLVKAWLRVGRGAGRLGRRSDTSARSVPARALARYHAQVRVPNLLAPLVRERVTLLSTWAHTLERGARGWWDAIREGGGDPRTALEEELNAVARAESGSASEWVDERLVSARSELSADFEIGGTRLLDMNRRRTPERSIGWSQVDDDGDRLSEWHAEVVSRLRLECALVRFRAALYRMASEHIESLRGRANELAEVASEISRVLRAKAGRIERLFSGLDEMPRDEAEAEVEVILTRLDEKLLTPLEQLARGPGGPRQAGDRLAETISRFVGRQPAEFVVHPLAEGDVPDLDAPPITFEFRRAASQCVDALLIERLRDTVAPVAEELSRARDRCDDVPAIVRAGFDALKEELAEGEDVSEEAAGTIAETLVRGADVLDELSETLQAVVDPIEESITALVHQGWSRLAARGVLSSGVGEQIAGLRSRVVQGVRKAFRESWELRAKQLRGLRMATARRWRSLRVWVGRFQEDPAEAGHRSAPGAIEMLSRAEAVIESLPLVYRRLFTLGPVRESTLLVGRSQVLARILAASTGDDPARPLLLLAEPGAGVSSVFAAITESNVGERARHVIMRERMNTEEELVGGFESGDIDGEGYGLGGLAQAVKRSVEAEDGAPIVLVEGIEHAFLRSAGGGRLVESFFASVVESSESIVWVVSVAATAWQILSKGSPHIAAGFDVASVSALTREELEEAVWRRHQRSGIPMRFADPADAGPLLSRRLRRARGDEDRQAVLRQEYFDRIHRIADGFPSLALLMWLDGFALADSETGGIVSFPPSVNGSFLEPLEMEEAFALKSFLEHGSLTVDELAAVVRVRRSDSERIIRRLEGLEVLEQATVPGGSDSVLELSNPRLRVRRVAVPLVLKFLRGRNVLH